MHQSVWCEHLEKRSKYTMVDFRCSERKTVLRVQSWYCPECGVHGAETEIVDRKPVVSVYEKLCDTPA